MKQIFWFWREIEHYWATSIYNRLVRWIKFVLATAQVLSFFLKKFSLLHDMLPHHTKQKIHIFRCFCYRRKATRLRLMFFSLLQAFLLKYLLICYFLWDTVCRHFKHFSHFLETLKDTSSKSFRRKTFSGWKPMQQNSAYNFIWFYFFPTYSSFCLKVTT